MFLHSKSVAHSISWHRLRWDNVQTGKLSVEAEVLLRFYKAEVHWQLGWSQAPSKTNLQLSFWKPPCVRGRPFSSLVATHSHLPLLLQGTGNVTENAKHVVRGCRIIPFSVDKMGWTGPCVLWRHPVLSPNSCYPSSSLFRISREPIKTHSTSFRSSISATNSTATLYHRSLPLNR